MIQKLKIPEDYSWFNEDTFVFTGTISYYEPNYETVYRKGGSSLQIQSGGQTFRKKMELDDYFMEEGADFKCISNKLGICTHTENFQFNLVKYKVIRPDSQNDDWNFILWIIHDNQTKIQKATPYMPLRWAVQDQLRYYSVISEVNYKSRNSRYIQQFIPDSIFFSYENRKEALERIDYDSKKLFTDNNYEEMTDAQRIKFIQKRFQEHGLSKKLIQKFNIK